MKQTLIIPGRLPGLNEIIKFSKERKGKYFAYHQQKLEIEQRIAGHILACNFCLYTGKVFIRFTWVEENKDRDPDNIAAGKKFILDALVKKGVILSDGWKHIGGFTDTFSVDKNNPHIKVDIWDHVEYEEYLKKDSLPDAKDMKTWQRDIP